MDRCKAEWCSNKPNASGKGYCRKHYDEYRKTGCVTKKHSIHDPNDIDIHDTYAEVVLRNIKGVEVARAIIDLDDVDNVKQMKWSLHSNGYVRCGNNGTTIYMHRHLMNPIDDKEIDHINLNKLDNRKSNLRICDHVENCWNRKSSKRGIKVRPNLNKQFCASITVKGKHIHLGYHSSYEEALSARLEAEKKHHKEFQNI
ncbi:HNH endonuclease [Exiguobacterium sp. s163]|uniref:HNH endonuclease n=1 Tax=Exiguobacterium sp. s163 TaxID=2751287 RepID=UPI001BE8F05F|nr:HNH endonuclease [Exiguobacterium sp. s163]